jgi:uncharacterized glyoxalase superfamily metalloenzyme YdcJ
MKQPDVLALEIEQARAVCEKEGLEVEIVLTKPPSGNPDGLLRVVRSKFINENKIMLTVAYQNWRKGVKTGGLSNYR